MARKATSCYTKYTQYRYTQSLALCVPGQISLFFGFYLCVTWFAGEQRRHIRLTDTDGGGRRLSAGRSFVMGKRKNDTRLASFKEANTASEQEKGTG